MQINDEQVPQKTCDWFREHRNLQATAMSVNFTGMFFLKDQSDS
jgi:hypothetical protein